MTPTQRGLMRTRNLITAVTLFTILGVLVALTVVSRADATKPWAKTVPPQLLERIQDARERTWACEDRLALTHTKASSRPLGSRAYARWVLRIWQERANTVCRVVDHLRGARVLASVVDPCLVGIIRRENARFDPTIDYGWGHGNVHEAYGIPQANPGTKMASHGADWRTNPITQLRWMADYARARYGSNCGALHHRITRGMY